MGFALKKLVSRLFFPVPLCVELMLVGAGMIAFTRRKRRGRVLLGCGVSLLVLLGYPATTEWALRALEHRIDPAQAQRNLATLAADTNRTVSIVVLGQGFSPSPALPLTADIGPGFLTRLVEGVRVHRMRPDATVTVSLPGTRSRKEKRAFLDAFADLVGLDPSTFRLLGDARDTADEARRAASEMSGRDVVLVTDAAHMPRAVKTFEAAGLRVWPAPSSYAVRPHTGTWRDNPAVLFPSAAGLGTAEHVWYEYMGLAWEQVKSWFMGEGAGKHDPSG